MVNQYQSGLYDGPSGVPGLTQGEFVLTQLGFVDRNGFAYSFEWAWYAVMFSLLICVFSVIAASISLVKVRFATGKTLANDSIEEEEDGNIVVEAVETELPFQKVDLTFKDMHYTVTSSIGNEKLELLKGIDGVVEAGKMTALVRTCTDDLYCANECVGLASIFLFLFQFVDGIFWSWEDDFDGRFVP